MCIFFPENFHFFTHFCGFVSIFFTAGFLARELSPRLPRSRHAVGMTQGQPSGHLMPHLGHRRRSADEPRGLGGRVPALSGLSDDDPTVSLSLLENLGNHENS